MHLVSTCLVWLLYLASVPVANDHYSKPVRKFSSQRYGHPLGPARLHDAPFWHNRQISEGTAYTKLSVSYVAVVGICVVSRMIQQVTRVLHMPQDDSHAPSKPIAPIVNEPNLNIRWSKDERKTRIFVLFKLSSSGSRLMVWRNSSSFFPWLWYLYSPLVDMTTELLLVKVCWNSILHGIPSICSNRGSLM